MIPNFRSLVSSAWQITDDRMSTGDPSNAAPSKLSSALARIRSQRRLAPQRLAKGGSRSICPPSSAGPYRGVFVNLDHLDAPASRKSSIFLGRIVGAVFVRVNPKCAHRMRPPVGGIDKDRSGVDKTLGDYTRVMRHDASGPHAVVCRRPLPRNPAGRSISTAPSSLCARQIRETYRKLTT